jgi:AcrR family transcriptional regulator
MPKTNMKDTIKNVSIDLFYKKGYFASSINDIARAAGIQKSSIYYHYSNKEDILFDILKTAMIDLDSKLESRLSGIKKTEERMRTAIYCHTLFHMRRQKEVLISDSELRGLTVDNYKIIIEMRDKYDRKFQSILKKGMDEGVFAENNCKILSNAIITMCTAVSIWFNPHGQLSKEKIAQIYADFSLKAIKL